VTEDAAATRVERAELLLDANRYDEAIAEAGKALTESPDYFPAQLVIARAHLGAGRRFDALQAAERAVALGPESAWAHAVVAQAAMRLHRLDRADRATTEACRLSPHWPFAHYLRMRVLLQVRNLEAAKEEAAQVMALDRGGSLGHVAQGEIALYQQAWAAAEEAYRRALEQNPENPNALLNYGYALSRQGKDTAAIDAYTEAGRLDPRSNDAARNIVAASQRHLNSATARGTLRGAGVRLLWIVGWYAFGVTLAQSNGLAATALGTVLLVGLVVLVITPYRRLRKLPEPARSVLDSKRNGSEGGTWSRRLGAHPLVGPALMIGLALLAGGMGYSGTKSQPPNSSDRQQISVVRQ
jgi:tetratricopeptide (TPR) repeat protein